MERLPVLPLGQLVVYPTFVLPLALTDPKAVQLIDEIIQARSGLLLGVVKSMGGMEPPEGAVMNTLPHQLYDVGTLGTIVRMLKLATARCASWCRGSSARGSKTSRRAKSG